MDRIPSNEEVATYKGEEEVGGNLKVKEFLMDLLLLQVGCCITSSPEPMHN
jgi:hypothetical protein